MCTGATIPHNLIKNKLSNPKYSYVGPLNVDFILVSTPYMHLHRWLKEPPELNHCSHLDEAFPSWHSFCYQALSKLQSPK